MKNVIVFAILATICVATVTFAQGLTGDQILNKVYQSGSNALKTTATISGDITVNTDTESVVTFDNTILKRFTMIPNTDSGANLAFGTTAKKWTFINMSTTSNVYIKLGAPATTADFMIPPQASMTSNSKVAVIHAISPGSDEVQIIGLY